MNVPTRKKEITPSDILSPADYAKRRPAMRAEVVAKKKNRRLEVGPFATFYFECYETMLQQVQEMLHIEKGGEAQIADELSAYNPLIPQGNELIATVMFEIDDPVRRTRVLSRLGGIENTMFIKVGEEKIMGAAEPDQDRTTAEGKASSVQFVHFPFTHDQIAAFRKAGATVIVGMDHENYAHMAVLPEAVRQELAADFD
ncbi:DUF3501 family protein [Dongia deserti]|uniref:DUF3501 family protein n=1 Tax=Dongia deserti TaxID=2268030 RepID=UPI000E65DD12|nr:DUF3501 family protein [Dongia deserti]